jgi:hypothetical protein
LWNGTGSEYFVMRPAIAVLLKPPFCRARFC